MSAVLSLRLADDVKERLDRLSAVTRRPAAVYVREALEAHLDDLEDYYAAVEVCERIRNGEEDLVSVEDTRRELLGVSVA
nr:unnamed protein product [uncultured bacterium]